MKRFTQPLAVLAILSAAFAQAEIAPEKLKVVQTLPADYPEQWVFAHDGAFFHMSNGHYMVLDPAAETGPEQYKGMVDASFISSFAQSNKRNEFYVIETFYSRGSRGERTDVVTIYDPATLSPKGEIVLPEDKLRMNSMPERYSALLVNDDKHLVITNMSPATSVTVVDVEARSVTDVQPTPGCVLNYPTGRSNFSSLCVNGSFASYHVDDQGKASAVSQGDSFFSPMDNPIFEKPVIIGSQAYFIAFDGKVYNVDLSGEAAVLGETWSLLNEEDKAAGYRPGGWQLNAQDDNGLFYVLMHPEGYEGSHKDGGPELWVYDANKQERVNKITLETWGVSVAATHGENPYLLVTNAEMQVDVYQDGKYVRTLAPFGQETPFIIHANEM
ncbi:hypothetical protein L0B52_07780 [Suttonella sp. R2A3]|uniref:amine dehydrogenase large subunit n=1 Tax=Suttonella sp. R2A3 TaxID=2908648 RepID=UPI001F293014|nr:amine dehydrogenase large subunit [Suttonella sp. R2A3]UJF24227.1 hypothetical protein L0B52_07780 [Suttonella sp. R2A3]